MLLSDIKSPNGDQSQSQSPMMQAHSHKSRTKVKMDGPSDSLGRVRQYEQCLRQHPRQAGYDMQTLPRLIREESRLPPAYCIDTQLNETGFSVAIGFFNGQVRIRSTCECHDFQTLLGDPKLWDLAYAHSFEDGTAEQPRVTCVAFSPDGKWLASTSWDGTCAFMTMESRLCCRTTTMVHAKMSGFAAISHECCTNQVAWCPDSQVVAVAVSRVRKFQGQTHPEQIPGGVALVSAPSYGDLTSLSAGDNGSCTSKSLSKDVRLKEGTLPFRWITDAYFPAAWSVAIFKPPKEVLNFVTDGKGSQTISSFSKGGKSPGPNSTASTNVFRGGISTGTTSPPRPSLIDPGSPGIGPEMSWALEEHVTEQQERRRLSDRLNLTLWEATAIDSDPLEGVGINLFVAAGCGDASVRVLNGAGCDVGQLIGHRRITTNGGVWDVTFLPHLRDGSQLLKLASAGEDHTIIVWDVVAESIIAVLPQPSQGFGILRVRCFVDRKPEWDADMDFMPSALQLSNGDFTSSAASPVSEKNDDVAVPGGDSRILPLDQDNQANQEQAENGRLVLVSVSWDNSLRIWDVESASLMNAYHDIHNDAIFDVSLVVLSCTPISSLEGSPTTGETCSVLSCCTVGRDRVARLWNLEIGSLEQKLSVHKTGVVAIEAVESKSDESASHDSLGRQVILSASKGGEICAVDVRQGKVLSTMRHPDVVSVCSMTLAPSSSGPPLLAYGDSLGDVRMHALAGLLEPRSPSKGSNELLAGNGSCSDDSSSSNFFGPEKIHLRHSTPKSPGLHEIQAICWLQEWSALMSCCTCSRLSLYQPDLESLKGSDEVQCTDCKCELVLPTVQRSLCTASSSSSEGQPRPLDPMQPGGPASTFLSGGENGIIFIWSIAKRARVEKMASKIIREKMIRSVMTSLNSPRARSPGGNEGTSSGSTARVSPQGSPKGKASPRRNSLLDQKPHDPNVRSASPTAKSFQTISKSNSLLRIVYLGQLRGHRAPVSHMCLTADGMRCVSGSWDGSVICWHVPSRSPERVLHGHTNMVTSVCMIPHTNKVVSTGSDKRVIVWNVPNSSMHTVFMEHEHSCLSLAVSADGKTLMSGDASGSIVVRPLASSPSLLQNWRNLLQLKNEDNEADRASSLQVLKTFLRPRSMLLQMTLFPYRTTLLHYFSMTGDVEAVEQCISMSKMKDFSLGSKYISSHIGFKRDCWGKTPIDWALELNHADVLEVLLRQAAELPKHMGEVISSSLPAILHKGSLNRISSLPLFLDSRLQPPMPHRGELPNEPQSRPEELLICGSDFPGLEKATYSNFYGFSDDNSLMSEAKASLTEVLYLPHFLLHVQTLADVYKVSPGNLDDGTLQCAVWEMLMQYLWNVRYAPLYKLHVTTNIATCMCSVAYLAAHRRPRLAYENGGVHPNMRVVHAAFVLLINLFHFVEELTLWRNLRELGNSSHWNHLKFLNYILFSVIMITDTLVPEDADDLEIDAIAIMSALGCLTLVFSILYYIRAIGKVGVVMRMVTSIAKATSSFLVVFLVIVFAFTLAFWFLSRGSDETMRLLAEAVVSEDGCNCDNGIVRMLKKKAGGKGTQPTTDLTFLEILQKTTRGALLGDFIDVTLGYGARFIVILWILYACFVFLVTVVMLNLLIAIMGGEYAALEEQAELDMKRERYSLMKDLDKSLQTALSLRLGLVKPPPTPRYLVVSRPESMPKGSLSPSGTPLSSENEARTTSGAEGNMDNRIASLMVSHFSEVENHVRELKSKVDHKCDELDARQTSFKTRMTQRIREQHFVDI